MTNSPNLQNRIEEAKGSQSQINQIYRDTIGLIDSLKNRSKLFMSQISDIEDGLFENDNSAEAIEKNVNALTQDIEEFNRVIKERNQNFANQIKDLMSNYQELPKLYKGDKGELSMVLDGRKRLLFLDLMIRRFRTKINSLQQMNNSLLSFSKDLSKVKEAYKKNLSMVNAELANSLELCDNAIRDLEGLN